MRRTISQNPNLRSAVRNHFGTRDKRPRRLELFIQALHAALEIIWTLGVLRLFVVPAAAREIGRQRIPVAWQRAVRNAIAVYIFVARKSTQPFKVGIA